MQIIAVEDTSVNSSFGEECKARSFEFALQEISWSSQDPFFLLSRVTMSSLVRPREDLIRSERSHPLIPANGASVLGPCFVDKIHCVRRRKKRE